MNEKGLSIGVSAPSSPKLLTNCCKWWWRRSSWQLQIYVCMYVICMYQMDEKGLAACTDQKRMTAIHWLCLPLETTLNSFSELIEPFGGTSVAGGTDWMLTHSLTTSWVRDVGGNDMRNNTATSKEVVGCLDGVCFRYGEWRRDRLIPDYGKDCMVRKGEKKKEIAWTGSNFS
jgi:hypothetical protein